MNILEPLCMDRRTKEHNQSYVIMYLCQKEQKSKRVDNSRNLMSRLYVLERYDIKTSN